MMEEHPAALQKMHHLMDQDPSQPWPYVIASHSYAEMNNITGLEVILTKADANKINLPIVDFIRGFYLESKGQAHQALKLYESGLQSQDVEMFSNMFRSRVDRIRHETY